MIERNVLLEKLNKVVVPSNLEVGFNPSPEDRGNSMRMRLRRLVRYRGAYIAHIARYFREHLKALSKTDVHAKTFWGRELILPNRDSNAQSIYKLGVLAANEDRLTRFLIKELRNNDIFYDIGANYGFYTALAQELITDGEIHAFEPGEKVFSYLQQLARSGTFLNKMAVNSSTGNVQFFDSYTRNSSGKSTISSEVALDHKWHYETRTVQAITLEEYCRTHRAPTVIKMDVEGAESEVLAGGISVFEKNSPIVAIELWSGHELYSFSFKTLAMFKKIQYEPFLIQAEGDLKETTYEYLEAWLKTEQQETNMIFKKRDSNKGI